MADIWQVTDWRLPRTIGPAYERLIAAIGSEEFGATVRGCVDSVTSGVRRIYLFETSGDSDALAYYHCEPRIAELLPTYSALYKQLDPIGTLYAAAPHPGDTAIQRVRPGDIGSTGFRRRFFEEAEIVERISIVQCVSGGWRGMNVARHASVGCFSEAELDALAGLALLALPMLSPAAPAADDEVTVSLLEERFGRRCATLTRRERQVCARAALGMSVRETALELGIAATSVVTLRQRAYRRLGVASAIELCRLVAS